MHCKGNAVDHSKYEKHEISSIKISHQSSYQNA